MDIYLNSIGANAAQHRAQLVNAILGGIDRSHKQRILLCAAHPQVLVTLLERPEPSEANERFHPTTAAMDDD